MTARRRELFFRVIDNYADINAIGFRLHFLTDRFPSHQLDEALAWLVANNLTGPKFVEWFKTQCKNSDLEMHRFLLMVVDNSKLGAVIAGKNFRT